MAYLAANPSLWLLVAQLVGNSSQTKLTIICYMDDVLAEGVIPMVKDLQDKEFFSEDDGYFLIKDT